MKIVEIDPITAISLGETAFLTDVWSRWPEDNDEVYAFPPSPVDAIVRYARDVETSELEINIPREKQDYLKELSYLASKLTAAGIETRVGIDLPKSDIVQLSAFAEVPRIRKMMNMSTDNWLQNPLWGSLLGLSNKLNLDLLGRCSERLRSFLPKEYRVEEIRELDPDTRLVMKPIKGTGSAGIKPVTAGQVSDQSGYIFQEVITPRTIYFGDVITPSGEVMAEDEPWVGRLSIYVGKYGLSGAQVTARRSEGFFTNVHGQADAVQSPLAVWAN
jgi:hypothetical protein